MKTPLILLGILLLTACAAPATLPPPAAPPLLRVALSPALRPLEGELRACAAALPQVALLLTETPAQHLNSAAADIRIQLGAPATPGYATLLGEETIVIIVHPQRSQEAISFTSLQAIFRGETGGLGQPGATTAAWAVWSYPAGDDARAVFDAAVLDGAPLAKAAWLAPDPQAMLTAVSETPNAIGYLPQSWLQPASQITAPATVLPVDELLASRLRAPIVALTEAEPQGAARELLACLQENP